MANNIKNIIRQPTTLLALYVFVVLFFVSIDSYTHNLLGRTESAFLFTGGKAWMNGMIPYCDFGGSRGPLLWLIYGIGYLISPFNYTGIFWLSFLMYAVIYYYIYRTAYIFLKDDYRSILCTILLTLSFFNPWFHYEMRGEEWCLFFVTIALYKSCSMIYDKKSETKFKVSFFYLGICFAAITLIKISVAFMFSSIIVYCFYYIIQESKSLLSTIGSFICGLLIILTPCFLYMSMEGNFAAFFHEYFIPEIRDTFNSFDISQYIHNYMATLTQPVKASLFILSMIGCIMMAISTNKFRLFFFFHFLSFYSVAIYSCTDTNYPLSICLISPLWFIIGMMPKTNTISKNRYRATIPTIVLAFTILFNYTYTNGYILSNLIFYGEPIAEEDNKNPDGHFISNLFFTGTQQKEDFQNIGQIMSQISKPTFICYMMDDEGYGILANALPGAKCWAGQSSVSIDWDSILISQKPDFVIIDDANEIPITEKESVLRSAGYTKSYSYKTLTRRVVLFTKHKLRISTYNSQV